jgi:hypothetical protein
MQQMPDLQERPDGMIATTSGSVNPLIRAVKALAPVLQTGMAEEGVAGGRIFLEAKITGPVSGQGGRYFAKTISRNTIVATTGNLNEADIGDVAAAADAVVWNLAEMGLSTHDIPTDTIVYGEHIADSLVGGGITSGQKIIEIPYYKGGSIPPPTAAWQVLTTNDGATWIAGYVRARPA